MTIAVARSPTTSLRSAMIFPNPPLTSGMRTFFITRCRGATGAFFDCFVLISNPNATAASVNLTYLLENGQTITQAIVVPPLARHPINVELVDPLLANAAVSTTVISNLGIVVERAMYWPDISQGWQEAHNSFGVTDTALRWAVADGRVGGPRGFATYVLLANPHATAAEGAYDSCARAARLRSNRTTRWRQRAVSISG
jgi:hypothetical protein